MKNILGVKDDLQHYRPAEGAVKQKLLNTLSRDRLVHQRRYTQRFIEGTQPKRPRYLRFSSTAVEMSKPLSPATVFHKGLVQDPAGAYWIVKAFNPQAREDLEPRQARNSPRYERVAYLLAQDRANYAEVRLLPQKDHYVSRVVMSAPDTNTSWPHTRAPEAFAGIFVANVFMRKWDQHLNNFSYSGDVPVSIDHDVIGPSTTFPHTALGTSLFNLTFLSFKLVSMLSYLTPRYDVDQSAKEGLQHHFVRQNTREAWWIMRDLIHGLGLGAGLLKAEGLQAVNLRRSIRDFKQIPSIHRVLEQAGFQGRELSTQSAYLQESLKNLGRNVGFLWQALTGENGRFEQLDT